MNESYQEAAMIEAKNLGEGTAEYYRHQQNVLSGSFNAGRINDNFAIQPRMQGTLRGAMNLGNGIGGDTMMFSNK